MGKEYNPELRGFDSYELRLGDEMRGERASMGKSLLDVQRELRIRADYIAAIEDADASAFPFAGFAAGYVRSYARYLDMDGDDVYRRFCAESGFEGVGAGLTLTPRERAAEPEPCAPVAASGQGSKPANGAADRAVISTMFMKSNASAARVDFGSSLRGLASVAVLAVLVGGLGYGGWSLLQDLQRLGFAPLPTAPEVLVTAPDIFAPAEVAATRPVDGVARRDDARVTLASIYAAQEAAAPVVAPRDGPISSIDPKSAGIYALPTPQSTPVVVDEPAGGATILPDDHRLARAFDSVQEESVAPAMPAPPARQGVDVFATADAWVRVRDGERRVLFTGILGPGERFTLPEGATAPQLRAGNAGAVYILVDGAAFGPLGEGPQVAKNVDLKPDAVRAAYPEAADFVAPPVTKEAGQEAALEPGDRAVALRDE
ncbi:helix-turn-helix domain-containing protein [Pikeienuella piscinae]|uniref:Helix-turn-helix domain-containing protein n=1 Tax=Pikeienuella piscinae TaxID=2748098 RepID=A0A7L5BTH0_9RHOB|nr:helix-turn-helix domain-containing protein [Pikeienuella piscinae]QIE54875.1 helix-turn-helix domain-containing protein [Pikeienuella piscinae]